MQGRAGCILGGRCGFRGPVSLVAPGRRDPLGSRLNVLLVGSLRHIGLSYNPLSHIITAYRRALLSVPWANQPIPPGAGRPLFPGADFRLAGMPVCPGRTVESLIRIAVKWAISQVIGCG